MAFAHHRWMYNRNHPNRVGLRDEFKEGVAGFIAKARTLDNFCIEGTIRYPCVKCKCVKLLGEDIVTCHLFKKEFMKNYYVWIAHGENLDSVNDGDFHNFFGGEEGSPVVDNNVKNSRFNDMMRDVFEMFLGAQSETNDEPKKFFKELEEASCPLYEGSMHSKLSVVVRLLQIKSDSSISQSSMNFIIGLMNELNQCNINLLKDFYTAKKLVFKLGLSSERIHYYENGCMLFYKDDASLDNCKFCNKPHYKDAANDKKKKTPMKAMHYLPLIPRLKRLYASMSSAPHMRWHYEHRRLDSVLWHPSNGEA
ncbi:uncharacterized protein LOC107832247 [Nicotiana tabacum]|uniref:Uncharacterized protein LOC107832247 n=1 Tax=Nicotiana tabacum TaxID=4097 RepID=A0A1S4DQ58_TOBAC|nr:PREDICTED: uncharacterized protein LOC107832247 [Nicotiana tabacum]